MNLKRDDWHRLYAEGWKDVIADDAFCHPAKFARGLIRRIYEHVTEEGWVTAGDWVIDPFGGVALGALDAMWMGLHWIGVELEPRFVALGTRNIELWNGLHADVMRTWGTATLLQGDSQELGQVVRGRVQASVSSPPYASGCQHTGGDDPRPEHVEGGTYHGVGIQGAISSPPYGASMDHEPGNRNWIADQQESDRRGFRRSYSGQVQRAEAYGETNGQLGAMPEGEFDAAISSPPFSTAETRDRSSYQDGYVAEMMGRAYTQDRQGEDPRNLARMEEGEFDVAVSSPPYEASMSHAEHGIDWSKRNDPGHSMTPRRIAYKDHTHSSLCYGDGGDNLGNQRGETFWSAARAVVEEVYRLLAPGGVAIWVVKDFVRDRKRVRFSQQWARLCVAVGFEWLHEHRAWVVEDNGTQLGFFEDRRLVKERKSFFRRLAERKGSPRIDWESVLCLRKREAHR